MSLNRERSPRAVGHLDVDIKNIENKHLYVPTLNVSIGGFAIQCSMEERNQLTPQGDVIDEVSPVEVVLHLNDQHGQKESIHARCRIVYSRRIAQNKCQIGMNYIELLGGGEDKLMMFIQNLLKEY